METTTDKKQQPARLSTARSRELGEELRRVRHRARMSSGFVAEALGWSLGKLSKLETGSRGTSTWEIGTLLGRCGADKPTRDRILAIASEPDTGSLMRVHNQSPDSVLAVLLHEQAARTITTYEPLTVPSLVQTEDYARALTGNELAVTSRMSRQESVRRVNRPDTVVYIHEAALRIAVGGPKVTRDQLLHLTIMCGWPRMSPRVIPMSTESTTALRHPATLLTFAAPTKPLAYTETDTATVLHDDPQAVTTYEIKMRHLARRALPTAQSRDIFARWADAYDQETR
ncbi:hypothetical protein ALI22I_00985 [Saccharothrix sp. ALI-22-I]|uniref:helix-turn-helix domain-containing protein n=1 Tax=Saccharothrix sp. ALI-22-I TaxID=1933778 RepID=UPI00097BF3E8|nr:helix-turn-helix transcriptional regulator [Saccharothrix sp. ALI-22-I]ONI92954.1 hypothetical protein ALI22I_00985 [Saccharothrix sp. ALI-22-I]